MDRKQITAAVIEEAERLLAEGVDHAVIAARVGITGYVLQLIARYRGRKRTCKPSPLTGRRAPNSQKGIDAAIIRSIQRMLEAGMLPHAEIAREAGVSANTVSDVAAGRRPALTMARPPLAEDEQFLAEPIRCNVCRAKICIVPCRACRTRDEMGEKKFV